MADPGNAGANGSRRSSVASMSAPAFLVVTGLVLATYGIACLVDVKRPGNTPTYAGPLPGGANAAGELEPEKETSGKSLAESLARLGTGQPVSFAEPSLNSDMHTEASPNATVVGAEHSGTGSEGGDDKDKQDDKDKDKDKDRSKDRDKDKDRGKEKEKEEEDDDDDAKEKEDDNARNADKESKRLAKEDERQQKEDEQRQKEAEKQAKAPTFCARNPPAKDGHKGFTCMEHRCLPRGDGGETSRCALDNGLTDPWGKDFFRCMCACCRVPCKLDDDSCGENTAEGPPNYDLGWPFH